VTVSDASTAAAVRQFADAITAKATPTGRPWLLGTVSAVTTGAGTDGGDVVEVTIGDDVFEAPHLSSYAPASGHVVLVLLVNGSPLVLGRPVGFPTF
jgi:hypothetical protein